MAKDIWATWGWTVHAAQGPGKPYMLPADGQGRFNLVRVAQAPSHPPAYVLDAATLHMPPCWSDKNLVFFEYGAERPSNVAKLPLKPWDATTEDDWTTAAISVEPHLGEPTLNRLVGTVFPLNPQTPETLTLVRVDNATTDGRPLLVLRLQPLPVGNRMHLLQDGTGQGSGGPPH